MYIWNELTMDAGKKDGFMQKVGGNKANAPWKFAHTFTLE